MAKRKPEGPPPEALKFIEELRQGKHQDVCTSPTEVVVIAKSVDQFIRALVAARSSDEEE